jgi:hypothetical protein
MDIAVRGFVPVTGIANSEDLRCLTVFIERPGDPPGVMLIDIEVDVLSVNSVIDLGGS